MPVLPPPTPSAAPDVAGRIILHDYPASSACYRVRIALALKGLAYETRTHRLLDGEQRAAAYLALNPAGLVPLLEVDGVAIAQSLAIIDYLDAAFPAVRLIPADPLARAEAMQIALTIACDIHPLNNLRVLRYLEAPLGHARPERDGWYARWIAAGFEAIETRLAAHDAPYAGGATPGIGDCFLVPQLFNARRFHVDVSAYPRLTEIADRAAALPAFVAAAPPPPR